MRSHFIKCLGVLASGLLGASAVQASCDGPYQFPISDLENPHTRALLQSVHDDLENYFQIRIAAFCLDEDEWGAYYSVSKRHLVFGVEFFFEMANPPGNINAAIAIIAHEMAHAFQAHHGLLDKLVGSNPDRVKCIELHADYLAGGYMGWRSRQSNMKTQKLTSIFYDLGDVDTHSDRHHGKPGERFISFKRGFDSDTNDVKTLSSRGFALLRGVNCDE